jgi:hypothetical protein
LHLVGYILEYTYDAGPMNVKFPNNSSKWQMGFNLAFKGLILLHPLLDLSNIIFLFGFLTNILISQSLHSWSMPHTLHLACNLLSYNITWRRPSDENLRHALLCLLLFPPLYYLLSVIYSLFLPNTPFVSQCSNNIGIPSFKEVAAPGLENRDVTAVGIRYTNHVTPLYPQKLALTSPNGGSRSVGIVRSRTKTTEWCKGFDWIHLIQD